MPKSISNSMGFNKSGGLFGSNRLNIPMKNYISPMYEEDISDTQQWAESKKVPTDEANRMNREQYLEDVKSYWSDYQNAIDKYNKLSELERQKRSELLSDYQNELRERGKRNLARDMLLQQMQNAFNENVQPHTATGGFLTALMNVLPYIIYKKQQPKYASLIQSLLQQYEARPERSYLNVEPVFSESLPQRPVRPATETYPDEYWEARQRARQQLRGYNKNINEGRLIGG